MQIDYLREFLIVVEEGSYTSAAKRLFMSQPVLSKHMASLESELGAQLFIRSNKGLSLTPIGDEAYSAFIEIVGRYDVLLAALKQRNNQTSGQIRLGILSTGVNKFVIPRVLNFTERYPNISFTYKTIKPQEIINDLIDGKIDFGFVAQSKFDDRGLLSYVPIGEDEIKFLVPVGSSLARKGIVSPGDIRDRILICLKTPETTFPLNEMVFEAGYKPKGNYFIDEMELAAHAVEKFDGFYIAPSFTCELFRSLPNVAIVELEKPVYAHISLAYRTDSVSPLSSLFLETLNESI